jgi:hypothetical protein
MTQLHVPKISKPELYTPDSLENLQHEDLPYLREIAAWSKEFLAKPHPQLGRPGPVCPFLPRALKVNTIQLGVIRTQGLTPLEIEAMVRQYRDSFLALEPSHGDLAMYKAIMLIFPDLQAETDACLVDQIQQRLKPFFVEEGLMIGEFHQWNQTPGLHNDKFYPLRSPLPMLAIRFMVESDLPFLDRLCDDPEVRSHYLKAYLKRMDVSLEGQKRYQAQQALIYAQSQIEQAHAARSQAPSRCPFARLATLGLKLFAKVRAA